MDTPKQTEQENDVDTKVFVQRKPSDIQRYKLEKLMKNPDKPVFIPEPKEQKLPRAFNPPEFIRNIWGSSAGVGSGDFHIYRNIRRRQNAREKYQDKMSEKDQLDMAYLDKVEKNMTVAQERTSKKRTKRLKKKQKQQAKKSKSTAQKKESESDSESDDDEGVEEKPDTSAGQDCVQNKDNTEISQLPTMVKEKVTEQQTTNPGNIQDSSGDSDSGNS